MKGNLLLIPSPRAVNPDSPRIHPISSERAMSLAASACQALPPVDHPELMRRAAPVRSAGIPMAVSTSDAPPPRLQAEPVET
jgi:hypothetical protein